jgi:ankyrin repeat protein
MNNGDLYNAAKNGDLTLAQMAIDAGVDINYVDLDMRYGWSDFDAIEVAAKFGHLEVVRLFLRAGARSTLFGRQAIIGNHLDIVREWLAAEPDAVSMAFEDGKTPLMLAAASKSPEIAEILLEAGADPDALDDAGRSALSIAIQVGDDVTSGILRQRCSPKVRDAAEKGTALVPTKARPSRESQGILRKLTETIKSTSPHIAKRDPQRRSRD